MVPIKLLLGLLPLSLQVAAVAVDLATGNSTVNLAAAPLRNSTVSLATTPTGNPNVAFVTELKTITKKLPKPETPSASGSVAFVTEVKTITKNVKKPTTPSANGAVAFVTDVKTITKNGKKPETSSANGAVAFVTDVKTITKNGKKTPTSTAKPKPDAKKPKTTPIFSNYDATTATAKPTPKPGAKEKPPRPQPPCDDVYWIDYLVFKTYLDQFIEYRNANNLTCINNWLWESDGCTKAPEKPWGLRFHDACLRHDFGYKAYSNMCLLDHKMRTRIDTGFSMDLKKTCDRKGGLKKFLCNITRMFYHDTVRMAGRFHTKKCDPGHNNEVNKDAEKNNGGK